MALLGINVPPELQAVLNDEAEAQGEPPPAYVEMGPPDVPPRDLRVADIAVTLHRETSSSGDAVWHVRVMADGIDNRQSDCESEPQPLLNWLITTVGLVMGRVAIQQGRAKETK